MHRTTTLKMGSLAPAGRMRSEEHSGPSTSDPQLDDLVRSVNEVAEQVRVWASSSTS